MDTYDFARAYFDTHVSGTIYAVTVKGEVLIFETVGSLVKPDFYECKLIQKFKSKASTNGQHPIDFRLLKSGLLLHHGDGSLELYNLTNDAAPLSV